MLDIYAGMKIEVYRTPKPYLVRRSWRERLFGRVPAMTGSKPVWMPFLAKRLVQLAPVIGANDAYRVGDKIICGELFYDRLKKQIPDRPEWPSSPSMLERAARLVG